MGLLRRQLPGIDPSTAQVPDQVWHFRFRGSLQLWRLPLWACLQRLVHVCHCSSYKGLGAQISFEWLSYSSLHNSFTIPFICHRKLSERITTQHTTEYTPIELPPLFHFSLSSHGLTLSSYPRCARVSCNQSVAVFGPKNPAGKPTTPVSPLETPAAPSSTNRCITKCYPPAAPIFQEWEVCRCASTSLFDLMKDHSEGLSAVKL